MTEEQAKTVNDFKKTLDSIIVENAVYEKENKAYREKLRWLIDAIDNDCEYEYESELGSCMEEAQELLKEGGEDENSL